MSEATEKAIKIIKEYSGPPLRIMEVCGTHTHEIFRLGIRTLLPPQVEMISGPGCPVCVTPADFIDEALLLAVEHGVTVMSFGDLLRVPGSSDSLYKARSRGANVQMVYSPIDAADYAKEHPEEQVVFLSVGFETTTPACCLAVDKAVKENLDNFALLTANKTMPMAYEAMKDSADVFLYPGHVHAIIGTQLCEDLVKEGVTGVASGFAPEELLSAIAIALAKVDERPFFVNAYPRVVTHDGSPKACEIVAHYMEPCDAVWRGLGNISDSGMKLRDEFSKYDARKKFNLPHIEGRDNPACRCGEVLQGKCKSTDCPLFGKACTPDHPVGACMVSSEGSCSAYYQYGRQESV